jgi:hypothetical protein
MTTPSATLMMTVVVGILASVAFNWLARPWFPMQIGAISDKTSSLIGIAGAFIGLHIGIVIGLTPWPPALYLGAFVGTLLVMWGWHRWM